jgi:hypothetical protein
MVLQFWKSREQLDAAGAAAPRRKGIDLDALEELMNRRLRLVLRHTWLLAIFGTFLLGGVIVGLVYLTASPTVLKIAVGPRNSEDVKLVQKLAEKFRQEHASIRISPMVEDGPVGIKDIASKDRPEYDLAVVSSNPDMSPDWPVVAILRQNVMLLMVPAPGLRAAGDGKKAKAPKIEKIADLAGHRVGIVARTEANPELLRVVLDHYRVPLDKVQTVTVEPEKLRRAIGDGQIDAILVAGPATGHTIAEAVAAASTDKKAPSFIAIDHAEAITKRIPAYDSFEIVAGSYGGSPPSPADSVTTLSFPQYLVARKNLSDTKITAFSKLLYASRQALAHELPGVVKIESPSTDKDSVVLVHPGTEAYLGDNQKTFFDKYGDDIFYGLLILPVFGSALAAVAGYFRADSSTKRIRLLHRLLQLMKRARNAETSEALDQIQTEVDSILANAIQQAERNQLDEVGLMLFTLTIEQACHAIAERRPLVSAGQAGPARETSPASVGAAEAAE